MKSNKNHSIQDLAAKYVAGEATQEEINQVHEWGKANPTNKKFIDNYLKTWNLADKPAIQKELPIDVDAEWQQFLENIQDKTSSAKEISLPAKSIKTSPMWLRLAAIFLLAILSSYAIYYFIINGKKTYYAEDSNMEFVLPDGSQITLNAGSELSFMKQFNGDKRIVKLTGEAFFEVTPDPQKPFIVDLGTSSVSVLGTSFNIQAYPEFNSIEVVVASGKVKFVTLKSKDEVILNPGEKGDFNKKTGQLSKNVNADVNFLSWKTRSIQFDGATILEIVKTIQSVYHTKINIDPGVAQDCQVTASFSNQTLDAVLNVLQETLDLTLETNNGIITITGSGC